MLFANLLLLFCLRYTNSQTPFVLREVYMGRVRFKHVVVLQWLVLVLVVVVVFMVFLVGHSQCSRHTQAFMVKPKSQNQSVQSFYDFMPKGSPIPPSAPSKKHNGIGLQSSSQSP